MEPKTLHCSEYVLSIIKLDTSKNSMRSEWPAERRLSLSLLRNILRCGCPAENIMPHETSDAELWRLVLDGQTNAFEQVVERYQGW